MHQATGRSNHNPTTQLRHRNRLRTALMAASAVLLAASGLAATTAPASAASAQKTQQNTAAPVVGELQPDSAKQTAKPMVGSQVAPSILTDIANTNDGSPNAGYRIPGMVITKNGTVVATYDGRRTARDIPGWIDNTIRISRDGGTTWEAPLLNRTGAYPLGYGDPSVAYNPETNRIFVFYTGSRTTGFAAGQTGIDTTQPGVLQHWMSTSDDEGKTWAHRDITSMIKNPAWAGGFAASGMGTYVSNGPFKGRMIQQYTWNYNGFRVASAYSDDNGLTWKSGALSQAGGDENKVTTLSNGDILNHIRSKPYRYSAVSKDGGATYSGFKQELDLPDPADNGSLTRLHPTAADNTAAAKMLVTTNNDDFEIRRNLALRISCDDGLTWPFKIMLATDSAAYSTADVFDNGDIGLLYERDGYSKITFARIPAAQVDPLCAPITLGANQITNGQVATLPITVTNQTSAALAAGTVSLNNQPGVTGTIAVPAIAAGASATVSLPVTVGAQVAPQRIRPDIIYTSGGKTSQLVRDIQVVGTQPTVAEPGLLVEAVMDSRANDAQPGYTIGDGASYFVQIKNTGNVTLTNITTTGNAAPGSACNVASLAPGAWQRCHPLWRRINADDIKAGAFTMDLTATGTYQNAGVATSYAASGQSVPLDIGPEWVLPKGPAPASVPVARCNAPVKPLAATANSAEDPANFGIEDAAAKNVLDGNPATYWSTGFSKGTTQYPNWVTLDLGASKNVCQVTYSPRITSDAGRIGEYAVRVSDVKGTLGAIVARGKFYLGDAAQSINLPAVAKGRYVSLVAYTEQASKATNTTSVGDLMVLAQTDLPPTTPPTKPTPTSTVYRIATADALYTVTNGVAKYVTGPEWAAMGYPKPQVVQPAFVKYPWSDDIYAVYFWSTPATNWTWQKLTFNEWANAGAPTPSTAGWIQGTTLTKFTYNSELFAHLGTATHKLTFAEWQAMNFASFSELKNRGYAKTAGSADIFAMSDMSANRGTRITLAQWVAAGLPTPATIAKTPN